jgi:hypothetical protein
MINKDFHLCEYYYGKIPDVTFRMFGGTVHCRRCGKELKDCEVESGTLKEINIKRENSKRRE